MKRLTLIAVVVFLATAAMAAGGQDQHYMGRGETVATPRSMTETPPGEGSISQPGNDTPPADQSQQEPHRKDCPKTPTWETREGMEKAAKAFEEGGQCEKPIVTVQHINTTRTVRYLPKGVVTTGQLRNLWGHIDRQFGHIDRQFKTVNGKLDKIDRKVDKIDNLPTKAELAKYFMNPSSIDGPPKKDKDGEEKVEKPWLWIAGAIIVGGLLALIYHRN